MTRCQPELTFTKLLYLRTQCCTQIRKASILLHLWYLMVFEHDITLDSLAIVARRSAKTETFFTLSLIVMSSR